jgi:hypothetical protein
MPEACRGSAKAAVKPGALALLEVGEGAEEGTRISFVENGKEGINEAARWVAR